MSQTKCVLLGCMNRRYKDKYFCEEHWKNRRKSPKYKSKVLWSGGI